MSKQLETHAAGAADLQVDLDEDARGIVDQGVVLGAVHPECDVNERRFIVVGGAHSTAVAASITKTASLAIQMVVAQLEERDVDLTPRTQGKRVVVRHNGYCHYYDKQPRKTAQWKNEQRRFRK